MTTRDPYGSSDASPRVQKDRIVEEALRRARMEMQAAASTAGGDSDTLSAAVFDPPMVARAMFADQVTLAAQPNITRVAANDVLTVGKDTGTGILGHVVNGAAGSFRGLILQTAGLFRWFFGAVNDAEGGANAGSTLEVIAYDDTGAQIDIPVELVRAANGLLRVRRTIVLTGNFQSSGKFGCNGQTEQPSVALNAGATDLATVIALTNQIRQALINNGIAS